MSSGWLSVTHNLEVTKSSSLDEISPSLSASAMASPTDFSTPYAAAASKCL